jgi:hypothetical protein
VEIFDGSNLALRIHLRNSKGKKCTIATLFFLESVQELSKQNRLSSMVLLNRKENKKAGISKSNNLFCSIFMLLLYLHEYWPDM